MNFNQLVKLIVRSWWRDKLFVGISVVSLVVGIASTCVLTMFVLYEYDIEAYNPNRERIVRLAQNMPSNGADSDVLFVYGGQVPELAAAFSEVETYVRTAAYEQVTADVRGEQTILKQVMRVDSTFLRFFPFQTIAGNLQEAITRPEKVALNEETALSLWGTTDCIGKEINLTVAGERIPATVGAVYRQPLQTMLQVNLLVPLINGEQGTDCYFLLHKGTDVKEFCRHLAETELPGVLGKTYYKAITLHESYFDTDTQEVNPFCISHREPFLLTVGWLAALFVLLIACFNYVNLNFSRLLRQIHMLRIETLMGASLRQIRIQLFTDTFLLIAVSFVLVLLLLGDVIPVFNRLLAAHLTLGYLFSLYVWPWLVGFILVLTVVPALYMSRKVHGLSESSYRLFYVGRKRRYIVFTLQTFQFVVSIGLLSAFMVLRSQLGMIEKDHERFNGVIELSCDDISRPPIASWVDEVSQWKGVEKTAGAYSGIWGGSVLLPETEQNKSLLWLDLLPCDWDFLSLYRMELLDSLQARRLYETTAFPVIVNESFVRLLVPAGENPVGQPVVKYTHEDKENPSAGEKQEIIVGVIRDFRTSSLDKTINLLSIKLEKDTPKDFKTLAVRITDKASLPDVLSRLRQKWEKIYPDKPFAYRDMGKEFEALNKDTVSLSDILLFYAVISLLLTLFGLFGITRYAVQTRLREVSIRKIYGASPWQILWMLTHPFAGSLVVAFLLAVPITVYGMKLWLERFAYHASLNVFHFLLPLLFIALVILVTVAVNGFQAVLSNPTESIKWES